MVKVKYRDAYVDDVANKVVEGLRTQAPLLVTEVELKRNKLYKSISIQDITLFRPNALLKAGIKFVQAAERSAFGTLKLNFIVNDIELNLC